MRIFLFILALCFATPVSGAASAAGHTAMEAMDEEAGLPAQASFDGVTDIVWRAYHTSPAAGLALVAHSPLGFGEGPDAVLASAVWGPFKELLAAFLSYAEESGAEAMAEDSRAVALGRPLPERMASDAWFASTTYEVFRPSARYVSVLLSHQEYTGGAHGNSTYRAFSFDLRTGETLGLDGMFVDPSASVAALVSRIADAVQAQKEPGAPAVDRSPAAIDASPERMVLTPQGIRVVYAPYEMGSYSEGEFIVDIDKAELIRMGARPEIWR